jgi:hypothetical protein
MTRKNVAISWDMVPCSPYVNGRFGGTYHLHLQVRKLAGKETRVLKVVAWPNYRCENLKSYTIRKILYYVTI